MKTIHFFGECMVELRSIEEATMRQTFAGDVYNSAVYLKRCYANTQTTMVTAVGKDTLSDRMRKTFGNESLETEFVFQHDTKSPGMYLIETDETGERSFTYWRSDAAARKVVDFLTPDVVAELSKGDMFFFSGISLAVVEPASRDAFWEVVFTLKSAGVKIVFDPNYRARLWDSQAQAVEQFDKAFAISDLVLPGVEDLEVLYGISTAEDVIEFCKPFCIDEVVVKNGPESVVTLSDGEQLTHTIIPVTNVVDTTSAGDAFNGVYLGARLNGRSVADSVQLGAKAAGTVIQHPGAIAPEDAFASAMSEAGL